MVRDPLNSYSFRNGARQEDAAFLRIRVIRAIRGLVPCKNCIRLGIRLDYESDEYHELNMVTSSGGKIQTGN